MKPKNFLLSLVFTLIFFSSTSSAYAMVPSPKYTKPTAAPRVMRSCLARETSVKNRMTSLTRLVTTMETTFDRIANRVKSFYADKVLPTGKSISNYDVLVNDIASKKVLTQNAIDKAKADITGFSCTTGDAKVLMNQFRINMQAVKTALKNYRASINTLLVAVKNINEEE